MKPHWEWSQAFQRKSHLSSEQGDVSWVTRRENIPDVRTNMSKCPKSRNNLYKKKNKNNTCNAIHSQHLEFSKSNVCEQIVHHWGGASVLAHSFKSTCVPRVTKICATSSFLSEASERKAFLNCLFHLGAKTLLWFRGYLNSAIP